MECELHEPVSKYLRDTLNLQKYKDIIWFIICFSDPTQIVALTKIQNLFIDMELWHYRNSKEEGQTGLATTPLVCTRKNYAKVCNM